MIPKALAIDHLD